MSVESRDLEAFLPLKPVEFHVLIALLSRDRHGYGIVQDIAERTNGRIRLVPGNLYPVLRRLVEDGLLQEGAKRPAADLDHKQRRYYSITPLGKRVAAAEAVRLKALIEGHEVQELLEGRSRA
jgi:DNA-binding PadR family transcriptional regulator